MSTFPDFSTHGYQVTRELGYNSLGGRVTYLATKINTTKPVVIKQFQFAQLGASWTEYDAYEQEIKVLKKLAHSGIPRYLDAFGTDSGFCMVQEYKNAECAIARTFSPPDIKQIAIATLEILAYLQSQKPPVIHRDIKPENLLIDEDLNVYLVDFGFARLGGGKIAASSVVKGTMGFMPPEQMFNRQLTTASDLYGLGATLICLLTGTKSVDVGNLIDDNYSIHFRHLVPPLQQGWMNWLDRMVAPRLQDRYKSAADALAVLQSLDVSRLPKVRFERDWLQFTATEYGEIMTQALAISNPIPNTMLAGRWEVAPHPNDPPHTPYDHSWISFDPPSFDSNELECQITVDTSKLLASQIYKRQIVLRTNSEPDTYQVAIQVKTARLPEYKRTVAAFKERLIFIFVFVFLGWLFAGLIYEGSLGVLFRPVLTGLIVAEITLRAEVNGKERNAFYSIFKASLGIVAMSMIWRITTGILNVDLVENASVSDTFSLFWLFCFLVSALVGANAGIVANKRTLTILAFVVFVLIFSSLSFLTNSSSMASFSGIIWSFIMLLVSNLVGSLVVYTLFKYRIYDCLNKGFFKQDAVTIVFLTAGFCLNLGASFQGFLILTHTVQPLQLLSFTVITTAALAVTGIPLLNLTVFKQDRILAKYRQSKPNLIKP